MKSQTGSMASRTGMNALNQQYQTSSLMKQSP